MATVTSQLSSRVTSRFDKHVVGERRGGDEHLIAEVVFALLILLAAHEYGYQEQTQCES